MVTCQSLLFFVCKQYVWSIAAKCCQAQPGGAWGARQQGTFDLMCAEPTSLPYCTARTFVPLQDGHLGQAQSSTLLYVGSFSSNIFSSIYISSVIDILGLSYRGPHLRWATFLRKAPTLLRACKDQWTISVSMIAAGRRGVCCGYGPPVDAQLRSRIWQWAYFPLPWRTITTVHGRRWRSRVVTTMLNVQAYSTAFWESIWWTAGCGEGFVRRKFIFRPYGT